MRLRTTLPAVLLAVLCGFACEPEEEDMCADAADGTVGLYGVCVRDEQCIEGTTCHGDICQESCAGDLDCSGEGVFSCWDQVCQYECGDYPPEALEFAECDDGHRSLHLRARSLCESCGAPYCP